MLTGIILLVIGIVVTVGALASPHPLEYFGATPNSPRIHVFLRFVDTWWPFIFLGSVIAILLGLVKLMYALPI